MQLSNFLRRLNRGLAVYRELGAATVVSRLRGRINYLLDRDDPEHAEWLRERARADAAFDAAHGTRTGGIQSITELKVVGKNAQHGSGHIASDPLYFTEMMGNLDLDLPNFT